MSYSQLKINENMCRDPQSINWNRCWGVSAIFDSILIIIIISLPLIGPTNLNWADLCEELLGVRPQEGEIKGSVVKLS